MFNLIIGIHPIIDGGRWHWSGAFLCYESSRLAVLPAVGAIWSEAFIRPVPGALENCRDRY